MIGCYISIDPLLSSIGLKNSWLSAPLALMRLRGPSPALVSAVRRHHPPYCTHWSLCCIHCFSYYLFHLLPFEHRSLEETMLVSNVQNVKMTLIENISHSSLYFSYFYSFFFFKIYGPTYLACHIEGRGTSQNAHTTQDPNQRSLFQCDLWNPSGA